MRFVFPFLVGFVSLTTLPSTTNGEANNFILNISCDERNIQKGCSPIKIPEFINKNIAKLFKRQLDNSMFYLFLGSQFNSWNVNRPGFHRFFMELSDDYWNDASKLLKNIVLREGKLTEIEKITIKASGALTEIDERFDIKSFDGMGNEAMNGKNEIDWLHKLLSLSKEIEEKTSKDIAEIINILNKQVEFAHFLVEELSHKNVVRFKRLSNLVKTLHQIEVDGEDEVHLKLAIQYFDTDIINSKYI